MVAGVEYLARSKQGEWALFLEGYKNILSYAKIDVDAFSNQCRMGVKREELTSHNGETAMNVMAEAHKITRATVDASPVKLSYRSLFRAALIDLHKKAKAMQTQTPAVAQFTKAMQDAEKRIAELEAIDTTDGYIVVVGDNIRLPMNEVQGKWCAVENASIFWNREDAQRFAGRIVNGNGETGQVVKKIDQIAWEISEQRQLIANVQEWIAQAK